jgi:FAD/FMN-containing dehydrogenase
MSHANGALEAALRAAVGDRHVLADPDLRAGYERDWTGRFGAEASFVVRPGDAGEVAQVLAACAEHGVPVVPQGGNTGLVGAGVPRGWEVLMSLTRMDAIGAVDPATAQVTVGAGATLADLQRVARAAGFDAGVDFAARDSVTVGGLVATDAGGARALRHGTVRGRVAGLEAVLADGTVIDRMSGLLKDNAGYALHALLIGSEGTLGIVTQVRWRVVAALDARVTALIPLATLDDAEPTLATLRRTLPSLEAVDFMLDDGLSLVLEHLRREPPVPERAPAYLLVECAARTDPTEELAEALEAAGIDDAVVADDTTSRTRLWELREGHAEAISAAGVPHKMDVGVPLARLAEFARRVPEVVAGVAPEARTILFGHLGDGNVHVNVLGLDQGDDAVDHAVLELTASLGGTVSAEHGVGVAKAGDLGLVRSAGELAAVAAIKRALDPDGLLNPGAVLEAPAGLG